MTTSGWCQTAPGIPNHASAHTVCQMRIDGHIETCDCTQHDGHSKKEGDK